MVLLRDQSSGSRSIVFVRVDRDGLANSVSLGFTSNGGTFGVGVEIDGAVHLRADEGSPAGCRG